MKFVVVVYLYRVITTPVMATPFIIYIYICLYIYMINRDLELAFLPHFLEDFQEKYFSRHLLLTDQISLVI